MKRLCLAAVMLLAAAPVAARVKLPSRTAAAKAASFFVSIALPPIMTNYHSDIMPHNDSTFAAPWQPCYLVRLHGLYVSMTFSNGNMRFCRFTKKVLPCIISTVIHNMNCFSFLSSNRQRAARWCGFRRVWDIFTANRRLCMAQAPVFVTFYSVGSSGRLTGWVPSSIW